MEDVPTPPAVDIALAAMGEAVQGNAERSSSALRASDAERFAILFSARGPRTAAASLGGIGSAFFISDAPLSLLSSWMLVLQKHIVIGCRPMIRCEKSSAHGPERPLLVMTAEPETVLFPIFNDISAVIPSAALRLGTM